MTNKTILKILAAATLCISGIQAQETKQIQTGTVYLGTGLSAISVSEQDSLGNELNEMTHNNVGTFIAGFVDKSQYWGAEFRFSGSLGNGNLNGDEFDSTFINMGLFLKPQYKFDNNIKVYGLAGYSAVYTNYRAQVGYEGNTQEEHVWQYGAGVSYSLNKKVDIFVDCTSILDSDGFNENHMDYNYKIGGLTFGALYNF